MSIRFGIPRAIRDVLIAAVAIVSLVLLFERLGIGSGYTRIMLTGCGGGHRLDSHSVQ